MAQDLGSIYSSLGLRLDSFETNINKSVQGFYKLQTGVDKASSIMDNSVKTATSNIAKSYRVWELSNGDVAKSMDVAKNKADSLKGQINLLDKELSSSEKILSDIEKQCGANSKEYEEYKSKVLDLKIEHGELTRELKNTENGMNTVSGKLKMMEEDFAKIDTKYEAFDKIGGSVTSLGNKMTMGLTVPIVGAGVAVTKLAMDFEDGLAKVYTIADENVVSIGDMGDGLKKLSNDTGIAVGDLTDNVYDAISAGQKTGDALQFVEKSAKLAKAGFAEAGQSLDLLTTIMNSYELQASDVTKVSDILIATQNIGKTTVGELSSSMGKIIPTAKSVGVNLEQVATGYALMTSKGIATAETTTYMASMLNELGKSGTTASDAIKAAAGQSFPELIASGKSLGDVLNIMNEYALKNKLSLSDLFGSAEAGKAALVLSNNAGADFNNTLSQMGQSAGSTDTAFAKVSDTTKNKLKVSLNEMKNSAMALGEKLLPLANELIKHISGLADKFNSLSPATQETILKVALMTATIGPLLKVTGGAITGFGSLAKATEKVGVAFGIFKGASAVTTAVEGVGAAATVATGTAGTGVAGLGTSLGGLMTFSLPLVASLGGVALAGVALAKNLSEQAVPAIDLFAAGVEKVEVQVDSLTQSGEKITVLSDQVVKISERTKNAVSGYLELSKNAKTELTDVYSSSSVITKDFADKQSQLYAQMKTSVITQLESRKVEELNTIKELCNGDMEQFNQLSIKKDAYYSEEEGKVTARYDTVNKIIATAFETQKALTSEQITQITTLLSEGEAEAISVMSQTEAEANVILARRLDSEGRTNAEIVSNKVQSLKDLKDKQSIAAEEEYNTTLLAIERMKELDATEKQRLIDSATEKYNTTLTGVENTFNDSINKINTMYPEVHNAVDMGNGKIKTNADILAGEIGVSTDKMSGSAMEGARNWKENMEKMAESSETEIPKAKSWIDRLRESLGLIPSETHAKVITEYENRYSGQMPGAKQYASGTNNLGLSRNVTTTLNERGYELYQLPRGARVWNNQASEALVKQSAESTAGGILEQNREMLNTFAASISAQNNNSSGFTKENMEQLSIYISRTIVSEFKKAGIDRPQINLDPRDMANAIAPYQDEFENYKSRH